MKTLYSKNKSFRTILQFLFRILTISLLIATVSCNFIAADTSDEESLQKTQTKLSAEQTDLAGDSGEEDSPTEDSSNATLQAMSAQLTEAAALATQAAAMQPPPGTTPLVPAMTAPVAPPVAPPSGDVDQFIKNAAVLLFEDMVIDPSQSRYVKKTLEAMGIQNVKDDGNAIGWLKSDMLGSAPGGRPWDLVIIAQEWRDSVSGEFYDALGNLLNQGTSVILEDWHLGWVAEGAIAPTLAKCGVYAYPWVSQELGDVNKLIMWPLGIPHPVMTTPNSGLSFTRVRDYWAWVPFVGTQLALTGTGDGVLLVGTKSQEQYRDGTVAVCMGGRLTIQGFCSHNFEFNTLYPLWENYIYNALLARMAGGS